MMDSDRRSLFLAFLAGVGVTLMAVVVVTELNHTLQDHSSVNVRGINEEIISGHVDAGASDALLSCFVTAEKKGQGEFFNCLDSDGDESLSLDELHAFWALCRIPMPDSEVLKQMVLADGWRGLGNDDGNIQTGTEFAAYLTLTCESWGTGETFLTVTEVWELLRKFEFNISLDTVEGWFDHASIFDDRLKCPNGYDFHTILISLLLDAPDKFLWPTLICDTVDDNGDGGLDWFEIAHRLHEEKIYFFNQLVDARRFVFAHADVDGNSLINVLECPRLIEAVNWLIKPVPFRLNRFETYDLNGSGSIDNYEFQHLSYAWQGLNHYRREETDFVLDPRYYYDDENTCNCHCDDQASAYYDSGSFVCDICSRADPCSW